MIVVRLAAMGVGLAALASAGLTSSARASVLIVGDSLAVGTEAPLRAALPDMSIDADSANGRTSSAGVAVLRDALRPEHDTVVFDLGTNDGPGAVALTASSLAAARDLAGGRCLVVATLNHPPQAGIPIDPQNAMIRQFASETPNAVLVEWNEAAAATPRALRGDGVHASSGGYALRATLFAEAVRSCLTGGSASGPPPTGDRQASGTRRPRRPPDEPSGGLLATAALQRLAEGRPLGLLAGKAARAVVELAADAGTALTQSGSEPVLGGPY